MKKLISNKNNIEGSVKNSSIISKLLVFLTLTFLIIYFLIIAYPLFWMLFSSFKDTASIFSETWSLPKEWNYENFIEAWNLGISDYFFNSVLVTSLTILITVMLSALAAFGLSRYNFKGQTFFLLFIAGGLMFSPEVSLIPLFQLTQFLGIYNTYLALILPYVAFQIPLTVLLFRAHFISIDKELEEAAYLDGSTSLGFLIRIVIPLSMPIILTASVLISFFAWNEFMFSLVFLENDALKTIPTGLLAFQGAVSTNWGVMMAGLTISSLPIIILFLFTQKYFISGLFEGGVKN